MMTYHESCLPQGFIHGEIQIRQNKALILLLGFLGVFPGVFLGSLSSAFIDNVLIEKDFDRALPIILCYLLFTVMAFALDYSYTRLILANAKLPGWLGQRYFTVRAQIFTIILNTLIVVLLDYFVLIPCAALLLIIFAAFRYYTKDIGRNISGETISAIQTILRICMLFVCGLFVMRSRITIGELYAVNLFSGAIFTRALALMPQKTTAMREGGIEEYTPQTAVRFHMPSFIKSVLLRKKIIIFVIFLALVGMLSEGIFLTLQRINLRDCIPSGDWSNLLRNCLFMCGVTVFGFLARKGNSIGFQHIFHGNVPHFIEQRLKTISRLVLGVTFALYYGLQIWQYNSLLASQITIAGLIVCIIFTSLLMSEKRRQLWGEDLGRLYDMLTKLITGGLTTYIYCALALRVTEIAVGDLFVFLAAFQGFFFGIGALSKMILIVIRANNQDVQEVVGLDHVRKDQA